MPTPPANDADPAQSMIRATADGLDALVEYLSWLSPTEINEPAPGSPATQARSRARPRRTRGEGIKTAEAQAILTYMATVDHLNSTATLLRSPTLIGFHVMARVGVDAAARLFWICGPGLAMRERVRRAYIQREQTCRRRLRRARAVDEPDVLARSRELLEKVRSDARAAGLEMTPQGAIAGGNPTLGEMFKAVLAGAEIPHGDLWYGQMSELVHSEPQILVEQYSQGQETVATERIFQPTLRLDDLGLTLAIYVEAVRVAVERYTTWFGWDASELRHHCSEALAPLAVQLPMTEP